MDPRQKSELDAAISLIMETMKKIPGARTALRRELRKPAEVRRVGPSTIGFRKGNIVRVTLMQDSIESEPALKPIEWVAEIFDSNRLTMKLINPGIRASLDASNARRCVNLTHARAALVKSLQSKLPDNGTAST
jgi:hypothetical protein